MCRLIPASALELMGLECAHMFDSHGKFTVVYGKLQEFTKAADD